MLGLGNQSPQHWKVRALSFPELLAEQTETGEPKPFTGATLFSFLQTRSGREFRVASCIRVWPTGLTRQRKKQKDVSSQISWQDSGKYLLTFRGDFIEAIGPSGQSRLLSHQRFLEIFGQSFFRLPEATGRQVDLGPLFNTDV